MQAFLLGLGLPWTLCPCPLSRLLVGTCLLDRCVARGARVHVRQRPCIQDSQVLPYVPNDPTIATKVISSSPRVVPYLPTSYIIDGISDRPRTSLHENLCTETGREVPAQVDQTCPVTHSARSFQPALDSATPCSRLPSLASVGQPR